MPQWSCPVQDVGFPRWPSAAPAFCQPVCPTPRTRCPASCPACPPLREEGCCSYLPKVLLLCPLLRAQGWEAWPSNSWLESPRSLERVMRVSSPFSSPRASLLEGPATAVGRAGKGSGAGGGATYIAFLKHVDVIPAVEQQPFPRVPHVTKEAEIDVGICSCTFEFPRAHSHAVPGHWQAERGTPLEDTTGGHVLLPSTGLAAPHR